MKSLILCFVLHYCTISTAQSVEVQGELKVIEMASNEDALEFVTRDEDGTFTSTSLSSLPFASPGNDTTRTLTSDLELAKHLCECGNDLPQFLVNQLLENGYTASDLLAAGVPNTKIQLSNIEDGDGNNYEYVKIGDQFWLTTNLITTSFMDGTAIGNETTNAQWSTADADSSPAYCWYNNDISNADTYGALYNWYTVNSSDNGEKAICPDGWRVPSQTDFDILIEYIDPGYPNFNS